MGKKTDDADVKKECPSCGLGVALDARICEFCGWDFDEEDEWILQIEKLERDLVLEKQKFEPGTVGSKIESSLRTPAVVKKEQLKASAAKARLQQQMEEVLGASDARTEPEKAAPTPKQAPVVQEARPEDVQPVKAKAEPVAVKQAPVVREARPEEVRPVKAKVEPVAVEIVKEELEPMAPAPSAEQSSGKVRRIRKIKTPPAAAPAVSQAVPAKSKVIRKAKD